MQLAEPWQDRSTWSTTGRCPIEKAMGILGSRPAMLVMREAYYGTRRFDDFVSRVEVAPATAAAHLHTLTEAGLLRRQPYRPESGGRTRDEYVLTEAGTDLFAIVAGLFEWGRRYTDASQALELAHASCGQPISVGITCADGHTVEPDDVLLRATAGRTSRSRRPDAAPKTRTTIENGARA